ncbi:hypothetical protein ES705_22336 [subsurface metagenome]
MTMKRILVLAILAVLISFSGCASLKPFESVDNIPDGQGLVYFYSELSKKMVSMYVTSDETLFGKYTGGFAFILKAQKRPGTYFLTKDKVVAPYFLPPGKKTFLAYYMFTTRLFNIETTYTGESYVEVDVKAGETQYYRVRLSKKPLFKPVFEIIKEEAEVAKPYLQDCKFAFTNTPKE